MSTSSTSGSPTRTARADIIDLDRYIRASVRPSRHRPVHTRERLIVDAGGVDRVPVELSSETDSTPLQTPAYTRERCKQYSHDSGVSDGSYLRQRYRPHRRISVVKPRGSNRIADSNSSVREFKAACEKALREQQEQIARVAELCEKLVQPQIQNHNPIQQNIQPIPQNTTNIGNNVGPNSPHLPQTFNCTNQNQQLGHLNSEFNEKSTKQNFSQNVSQINRVKRISPCTSDVTSTSCSSRNVKMRDKHRSDSCKTYKLIMGKLDELSQLFATRRVPVQPRVVRGSSESVSVCDKVVATGDGDTVKVIHASRLSGREQTEQPDRRPLRVIRAHRVDIAPKSQGTKHGADDSAAQCSGPSDVGSVSDAFDLDNPLHLYAQAKRLQALHASSQRSSNRSPDKHQDKLDKSLDKLEDKSREKDSSVCALCRSYWRIIRQYFKQ